MMQAQQYTQGHRLDYVVIQHMQRQFGICSNYIDLLHAPNYRGKRYMHQGRIFIPLANQDPPPHHKCIIMDKNHTTRYLVEEITTTTNLPTKDQPAAFHMRIFEGYKYEPHKYLIHGTFHLFEMQAYHSYIGFDEIDLTCPKYQHLASKNIRKKENIGEVLFCKVARLGMAKHYYFDRQLKQIMSSIDQQSYKNGLSSDYFSYDMTESTLRDLQSGNDVSTKVLSYFFDRLTYAYYSQSWFRDPLKNLKVFKPHFLVNFFDQQPNNSLDCSFFNQSLLNVYSLVGKCSFAQQRLMVFPIFERNSNHFDLGAIYSADDNTVHVFELDPLDAEGRQGRWRQRLKLLIGENANLILKKIIACQIKAEVIHHANLSDISAPRQRQTPDCAIYICLYTLLLMEKYGFLKLSEEVKIRCKGDAATTELIGFMRKFLYNSYKSKEGYLLHAFQANFAETFANNYP